ncbi:MAG: FecR domain-containing protein [Gammaproteobacteria bacterium]
MSEKTEVERIEATAAEWLIANEQPLPKGRHAEFQRWLNQDPRHEVAYIRLESVWQKADRLSEPRPSGGVVPDVPLRVTRPSAQSRSRWIAPVMATAAALILTVVSVVLYPSFTWQTYQSKVGIVTSTVLSDASVVQLNGASQIRVRLGLFKREIELIRGEANFKVAHDASRPFDVTVGSAKVRAVGTAFTVRRLEDDQLTVVVTEGRVAISPAASQPLPDVFPPAEPADAERGRSGGESMKPDPVRLLEAGERANVARGELTVQQLDHESLKKEVSWTAGRLWFERQTLASVVAEFNRHNTRQMIVMDGEVRDLRIGGGFEATDPQSFLQAMIRTLPVRVDESDSEVWRIYYDNIPHQ